MCQACEALERWGSQPQYIQLFGENGQREEVQPAFGQGWKMGKEDGLPGSFLMECGCHWGHRIDHIPFYYLWEHGLWRVPSFGLGFPTCQMGSSAFFWGLNECTWIWGRLPKSVILILGKLKQEDWELLRHLRLLNKTEFQKIELKKDRGRTQREKRGMGKQKGGKNVGMKKEGRKENEEWKGGKKRRREGKRKSKKVEGRKGEGKRKKGERKEMLGTVWALESARRAATVTYAGVPVSEHLSSSTTSFTTFVSCLPPRA